jgi:hypothetical protein
MIHMGDRLMNLLTITLTNSNKNLFQTSTKLKFQSNGLNNLWEHKQEQNLLEREDKKSILICLLILMVTVS